MGKIAMLIELWKYKSDFSKKKKKSEEKKIERKIFLKIRIQKSGKNRIQLKITVREAAK